MTFKMGDTVFFVGARPQKCEHCNQDTPDLDFWIEEGIITQINEMHVGEWPQKPCTCSGPCFCKPGPDYSAKPNCKTVQSFRVLVNYADTYCELPITSLFEDKMSALKALDNKACQPVLVKRPQTRFEVEVGQKMELLAHSE